MIHYFRRFRMEFDLEAQPVPPPELPEGFEFVRWSMLDVERHAITQYRSFRDEMDSQLFPILGQLDGTRDLIKAISSQPSFLPATTWMLSRLPDRRGFCEDCGVIQGMGLAGEFGAIQNVGVIPSCRGLGLGRALVLRSLEGFRDYGVRRVSLEATAENVPATALYRSLGFRLVRTSYREVSDPILEPNSPSRSQVTTRPKDDVEC